MHKVSQGEEDLGTGEARSTAAYGNSNWADEFAGAEGVTKHPESSSDQDWAAEFTTNPQPDLAEQWTQEFSGNSVDSSGGKLIMTTLCCVSGYEGGASAEVFRSEAPAHDDFWSQLQQDWDKAADENPSTFGWLKETPNDPTNEVTLCAIFLQIF